VKWDQLTFRGSRNIVRSIPENTFPKKASSIWEIPDNAPAKLRVAGRSKRASASRLGLLQVLPQG